MTDCIHHWRIETPNGALSPGTCRHCGETRLFSNTDESERGSYGRLTKQRKAAHKGREAVRRAKERAMSRLEW